ncbi:hypothetical protein, partial [Dysosmobacter sp. HCP28S3_G4]|uniref:hypothetical protein n=1 Tax=Dysosmobacter sp. HCP28S3_G4 TaxID=3438938 RepID=UPI003F8A4D7D
GILFPGCCICILGWNNPPPEDLFYFNAAAAFPGPRAAWRKIFSPSCRKFFCTFQVQKNL